MFHVEHLQDNKPKECTIMAKRNVKSESVTIDTSAIASDVPSSGPVATIVGRLVSSDSPVKAKLIADMMPELTHPATLDGLRAVIAACRPGHTVYVIRGSKAVEVATG